jgi:hypothetical protein
MGLYFGNLAYVRATKPTQSISFTVPASAAVGSSATLSATGGGSGNPVVFSVGPSSGPGVCTVSGDTVTYTAAGSCVIDANQAGNRSYAAPPQVQRTITASKIIPQSISFTVPAAAAVGGSATLSATGGGSGNPVVFSTSSPGVVHPGGQHGGLHPGGQLRHRRQPGRQRHLRGRTPGPADDHGNRAFEVNRDVVTA